MCSLDSFGHDRTQWSPRSVFLRGDSFKVIVFSGERSEHKRLGVARFLGHASGTASETLIVDLVAGDTLMP